MSAVFDTLKQDVMRRKAAGFSTMHGEPLDTAAQYSNTSTVSNTTTLVVSGAAVGGDVIFAYSAYGIPQEDNFSSPELEFKVLGLFRSDGLVVRSMREAATMGLERLIRAIESAEQHERGVVVVQMPRKSIHMEQVLVRAVELPRKPPRVMLGYRTYEEGNG